MVAGVGAKSAGTVQYCGTYELSGTDPGKEKFFVSCLVQTRYVLLFFTNLVRSNFFVKG